jgi:hypothetical protein
MKMANFPPSTQEWMDLYNAALKFKQIECWNWMEDSDLFGVRNPQNGEIGYCCVLGALGEVFGLTVYLGPEGLDGYFKMQSGEISSDDLDAIHLQKCLMASYDDRKFLQKKDLQVIRSLDLKFRGSKAWPLFRNYEPGHQPWYLNKEETLFLTIALQQAREVSLRFKANKGLFTPPLKDHCLVRVSEQGSTSLQWRDTWLEFPHLEKVEVAVPPIDEIRVKRIKKMALVRPNIWECDFFYAPLTVHEGDKPFFPYALLWVDHRSGVILKNHLSDPSGYRSEFQNQFLNLIEDVKFLPEEVRVKREEAFKLLEPMTSKLEVKLILTKKVRALEEARKGMFDFFLNRKS